MLNIVLFAFLLCVIKAAELPTIYDYHWSDDRFMTFTFLDASVEGYSEELSKALFSKMNRAFEDTVFQRLPEWYFLRCKEAHPDLDLDLFEECNVVMKPPTLLKQFVDGLSTDSLLKVALVPPGQLRRMMFERVQAMNIAPTSFFAALDSIVGFKGPYLQSFVSDFKPFIRNLLERLDDASLERLFNEWDDKIEIILEENMDEEEANERNPYKAPLWAILGEFHINKFASMRLILHLILPSFVRRFADRKATVLLQSAAIAFPIQSNANLELFESVCNLFDLNDTFSVLKPLVYYNPFIVVDAVPETLSQISDDRSRNRLIKWTVRGILANYDRFNQPTYRNRIVAFVNRCADRSVQKIFASGQNDSFVPIMIETGVVEVNRVPLDLMCTYNAFPNYLSTACYQSPFAMNMANPKRFFKLMCTEMMQPILDAALGVHPYLSDVDLQYVLLFAEHIKDHSPKVADEVESLHLCKVKDRCNSYGQNSSTRQNPTCEDPRASSRKLDVIYSLVFGIDAFGPHLDTGMRKMLTAVARLYFRTETAQAESLRDSLPANFTIVDLFNNEDIGREWIINDYGKIYCNANDKRAISKLLQDPGCRQKFVEYVQSVFSDDAPVSGRLLGGIRERLSLIMKTFNLTIENVTIVPKPTTEQMLVQWASSRDQFISIFPLLDGAKMTDVFLNICYRNLLSTQDMERLIKLMKSRAEFSVAELFKMAINSNTDNLCGNAIAAFEWLEDFEDMNEAEFVLGKLVAHLEDHPEIDVASLRWLSGEMYEAILNYYNSQTTRTTIPHPIYFQALDAAINDQGPEVFKMFSTEAVILITGILGDADEAVNVIISRGEARDNQSNMDAEALLGVILKRFAIENPPTFVSKFWPAIKQRTSYIMDKSNGFLYVRIIIPSRNHGDRTILLRVPKYAVMADLYYLLKEGYYNNKVIALVDSKTKQVVLPDGQALRFLPNLEFKLQYMFDKTLPLLDSVASSLGLKLTPTKLNVNEN